MKVLHIEVLNNGGPGWLHCGLIDKDNPPEGYEGTLLYDHLCSSNGFALGDLIARRPERITELKEKYGEFEVYAIWLSEPWRPR